MKFEELNIDTRIMRAVEDMGFEEASPIQAQAIPQLLEGGGCNWTGTDRDRKDSSLFYTCAFHD